MLNLFQHLCHVIYSLCPIKNWENIRNDEFSEENPKGEGLAAMPPILPLFPRQSGVIAKEEARRLKQSLPIWQRLSQGKHDFLSNLSLSGSHSVKISKGINFLFTDNFLPASMNYSKMEWISLEIMRYLE